MTQPKTDKSQMKDWEKDIDSYETEDITIVRIHKNPINEQRLKAFIRSLLLTQLEEVEREVIGEDEKLKGLYWRDEFEELDRLTNRHNLREEQRSKLSTLKLKVSPKKK